MKSKLLNNVFWAITGQLGYVILMLIGNVILAKFLTPEEFGIVAIAMFFVSIFNVFIEAGVGGALVRKQNVSNRDYSTVFVFNLGISLLSVFIMIFIAKPVALFYEIPVLKHVLWVVSVILIVNAFTIVQNVKLVRNMHFKQLGIYKISSLLVAVIIACFLAQDGYGIWSAVILQVVYAFLLMSILWVKLKGFGALTFSKQSFKEVFNFGIFTTLSSLLNVIFNNIYELIIGKIFGLSQVGLYYQSKKLHMGVETVTVNVISNVYYSYLSKFQNNMEAFVADFIIISQVTAIILGAIVSLTCIYSEEIILVLYGNKWVESAYFLRLVAVAAYFFLMELISRNIFKVFNQTHKILYIELFKKLMQLITILAGVYYLELSVLLYGFIMVSVIGYFVSLYYSLRAIDNMMIQVFFDFIKITLVFLSSSYLFLYICSSFDIGLYYKALFVPVFLVFCLLGLSICKVVDKEIIFNVKEIINVKKNT